MNVVKAKSYFPLLCVLVLIVLIYLPALDIYLFGDGYVLLDYCYSGWRNPSIFFDLLNNFFRPIVNISYLLNYTLFGEQISLYVLTTLCIHLLNVFFLYLLLIRITGRTRVALTTVLLFGTSALYSGLTVGLAFAAMPDLTLLLFFLGIFLCFSMKQKKAGMLQHLVVVICMLGAIGSKEAWIILPVMLLSLLLLAGSYSFKQGIVAIIPISVVTGIYVTILFIVPWLSNRSSALDYSGFNLSNINAMLTKMAYLLCHYVGLGEHYYGNLWETTLICIAALLFLGILIWFNNRLALLGMCWMIVANIPTLPVPYTPSHYNYMPLVGFWIMIVAFVDQIIRKLLLKTTIRKGYVSLIMGLCVVYLVLYNAIMLQTEIKDYRKLGDGAKTVLTMYKAIQDQLLADRPLIFVNQGMRTVVTETSQSLQGYAKLLFVRPQALWELMHFHHLANFAGSPFEYRMISIPEEEIGPIFQKEFQVLVFTDREFLLTKHYDTALRQYYGAHKRLPDRTAAYQIVPAPGSDVR